jgi:hypothetical protein
MNAQSWGGSVERIRIYARRFGDDADVIQRASGV